MMRRHQRLKHLLAPAKDAQSSLFVLAPQPAEFRHVGGQDRGQLALDPP
jgi:hypothetical protein